MQRLKIKRGQQKGETPSKEVIAVSEYELSNDTLTFFIVKGLFSKRRFQVKQIPIYEITSIESSGNELSVTCNGVTDQFFCKNGFELFRELQEKTLSMLDERKKNLELERRVNLRKADLISAINASMDMVDLTFDILMGLNFKRINWKHLEAYSINLKENLNLQLQTMDPIKLDFSKIACAIKLEDPRETSKEIYLVLKSIHEYFESFKTEFDLKETHPNFQDTKNIIIAYYILNDLLLGKVEDEKDNKKEIHQLESILQLLANNTTFAVDIEALTTIINMAIPENNQESFTDDTRKIFRQQLARLQKN
jgi:hypothetical protein